MAISPKLTGRSNAAQIKFPGCVHVCTCVRAVEMHVLSLKFVWNYKILRTAKTIRSKMQLVYSNYLI